MTTNSDDSIQKDAAMFRALIELAGHFQDDSFTTIRLSGDDATRTWMLEVGKQTFYGKSVRNVIQQAIDWNPANV
jgi:hypothetical protein